MTLSAEQLAQQIGITRPMVEYWVKRGLPYTISESGTRRYDLEQSRKWIEERKELVSNPHARGVRPGLGRPPGGGKVKEETPDQSKLVQEVKKLERELELADPDVGTLKADKLIKLDGKSLLKLKIVEEILTRRVDRMKLEAMLLDAEEVKRTWTRAVQSISGDVRRTTKLLATRIIDALDIAGESAAKVRAIVDEEMDTMALRMSGGIDDSDEN